MKTTTLTTLRTLLPFLRWSPRVNRTTLRADAFAGLTNAVVVLPQGVAFALIAGLPPQYGLYTAIVPAVVAALFGSSWHLISGPTLALSITVYASLIPIAQPGTEEFVALALLLTLLAGLYQLAFGLARLGALVNFVSPAVITGFTAGAAILVVTSQLRTVLGIEIPRGGHFFDVWATALASVPDWRMATIVIAAVSFGTAIVMRRRRPGSPWLLIAMLAGAAVGLVFHFAGNPVPSVGAVPSSPPQPSMPPIDLQAIRRLAPEALAVALLGLIEAVAIGRSIAMRSQQRIDGNQEFIGQGLSNIVGAFSSCYASSGSFTRSGINYEAGAKSPMSAIFSALFLLAIIFFVAPLGDYLPKAAMGGMILVVAWNLVDLKHIREILRASRQDTVVLVVTFGAVLLLDLTFAILAGVLLSLVLFLNRAANPAVFSLAPDPEHPTRRFTNIQRKSLTECPQLKIARVDGPLFFGSVQSVGETLARMGDGPRPQRHLLLVCSGVNYIDSAGAQMLVAEAMRRRAMGGGFYLCALRRDARNFLQRSGYAEEFGEENIFVEKYEAIENIFERLEREICEECTARIFRECQRVPQKRREIEPIET